VERLCVGRVEPDRCVVVGRCEVELALLAIDVAAADIGGSIARVRLDRPVVVGERFLHLPAAAVYERAVGVCPAEAWIELDRLVEIGDRVLVAAGAAKRGATHIVGAGVVRRALDHRGERTDICFRGSVGVNGDGYRACLRRRAAGGAEDERGRDKRCADS
jgi:hypothetical protein